eukprot:5045645-Amphidinium_carterae.1
MHPQPKSTMTNKTLTSIVLMGVELCCKLQLLWVSLHQLLVAYGPILRSHLASTGDTQQCVDIKLTEAAHRSNKKKSNT